MKTTSRYHSLLDRDAVAASLARAGLAPARPSSAGPVRGFVRRPSEGSGGAALSALAFARPSAAEPPDFVVPSDTLPRRVKAFAAWLASATRCRQFFVTDAEGFVLVEQANDPVLTAICSAFLNQMERAHVCLESEAPDLLAFYLDDRRILYLTNAETSYGRYAIGFVVGEAVSTRLVARVRDALARAMREQDS